MAPVRSYQPQHVALYFSGYNAQAYLLRPVDCISLNVLLVRFQAETENTLPFGRHSIPARVDEYTVHRTKTSKHGVTDRCTAAEEGVLY